MALPAVAVSPAVQPSRPAAGDLVVDSKGRIHYIAELHPSAEALDPARAKRPKGIAEYHGASAAAVVGELEEMYGFQTTTMTSLVALTFAAYLLPEQVELLQRDPRVRQVSEDHKLQLSAVWDDQVVNGQTKSWGVQAVAGGVGNGSQRTVYVLDTGLGPHPDLNVVSSWAADGSTSPVGCYPHASHVAGIIGAKTNNFGTVGVKPGAKIVSVAAGIGSNCLTEYTEAMVLAGLDLIRDLIIAEGQVGIVNMSMNGLQFSGSWNPNAKRTVSSAMRSLATPSPSSSFPGAFIVQSAGNGYQNACDVSYSDTSSNDGIMVVGAIDANGQPIVPLNSVNGIDNQGVAEGDRGSNYGSCVEAWAPGNKIYSTWGQSGYGMLSGTSMAAPHVAGVALSLADSMGLTTPAQIEAAVRAKLVTLTGSPAKIPNILSMGAIAKPTVAFASSQCGSSCTQWQAGGNATYFDNQEFGIRYDSVGASSCTLQTAVDLEPWSAPENAPVTRVWPKTTKPGSKVYHWKLNCVGSGNSATSATYSIRIKRRIHNVAWQVKTTSTGGLWGSFSAISWSHVSVWWAPGDSFRQRFSSVGADNCRITTYGDRVSGPDVVLWNSPEYNNPGPLYDGGTTFYLGDPNQEPAPGPFWRYIWKLTCNNSDGEEETVFVSGRQS